MRSERCAAASRRQFLGRHLPEAPKPGLRAPDCIRNFRAFRAWSSIRVFGAFQENAFSTVRRRGCQGKDGTLARSLCDRWGDRRCSRPSRITRSALIRSVRPLWHPSFRPLIWVWFRACGGAAPLSARCPDGPFPCGGCRFRFARNFSSGGVSRDLAFGRQLPCSFFFLPFTGSYPGQQRFFSSGINHPCQMRCRSSGRRSTFLAERHAYQWDLGPGKRSKTETVPAK